MHQPDLRLAMLLRFSDFLPEGKRQFVKQWALADTLANLQVNAVRFCMIIEIFVRALETGVIVLV